MAVPRRIDDRYEILEQLHDGAKGPVYRVRHSLLGDERVLKRRRLEVSEGTPAFAEVERCARRLSQLSHPHLAQVYELAVEPGGVTVVMELVRGLLLGDLRGAAHGTPPLGLALEVAQQSLAALGHLHAHGIVHGDVGPGALMLTRHAEGGPQVKLVDLGIGRPPPAAQAMSTAGLAMVRLRYAAPEQFQGTEAEISAATDIYSLGIVLYELLTGRLPIIGDSPTSMLAGHLFRPPLDFAESDPRGEVPADLRDIVLRMLAKDPTERYPDSDAVATALAPIRRRFDLDAPEVRAVLDAAVATEEPADETPAEAPGADMPSADVAGLAPSPAVTKPIDGLPAPPADAATRPSAAEDLGPPDELARAVEELIVAEELTAARALWQRAAAAYSGHAELAELGERLAEIEQITHRPRVHQLVDAAQNAAASGDDAAAIEALREAVGLCPADDRLKSLLGDAEAAQRDRAAAARRAQALDQAARSIAAAIDSGDLAAARAGLAEAGESYGRDERLTALRRRLEPLEEKARQERLTAGLDDARDKLAGGDFAAALAALVPVLELDPANEAARRLERLGLAARDEHEAALRQKRALEAAAAEIAGLLSAGDAGGAAERLAERRRQLGDAAAFEELEARLETLRREQEKERRRAERENRRREAGELRERARRLVARGDLEEGLDRLEAARELDRSLTEISGEIATVREQLEEKVRRRQRRAAIDDASRRTEAALDSRDLRLVDTLLADAVERFGEEEVFAALMGRRDELYAQERQERVASLFAEAEDKAGRRQLDGALAALGRALELKPGDPVLVARRDQIRAEMEQAAAAKEREAAVAGVAGEIKGLLDEGRLDDAETRLTAAVAALGSSPALDGLTARLEDLRRQEVQEEIRRLIREADVLVDRGDLPAALGAVERAQALDPEHPVVRDSHRRVLSLVEQKHQREQRRQALERALAEVEELMDKGKLERAAKALAEADERWGPAEKLASLEVRLLRERKRQARTREVTELRRQAEERVRAGDVDGARESLTTALELAPGDRRLRRLSGEIDVAAKEKERRRRREADRSRIEAEIEALLTAGDFEKARDQLALATDLDGGRRDGFAARIEVGLMAARRQRQDSERRQRADVLVDRARSLSQTEDFTAAQRVLGQAVELVPDHAEAKTLSTSISTLKALAETEVAERGDLDVALATIRQHLAAGRPGQAMAELQTAIDRFGNRDDLRQLRFETARAFLAGDSDERMPADWRGDAPVEADEGLGRTEHFAPRPQPTSPPQADLRPLGDPSETAIRRPPAIERTPTAAVGDLLLSGSHTAPKIPVTPAPAATAETPARETGESAGDQPERSLLSPSDPRFWLIVLIVLILFALLGLWLGGRGGEVLDEEGRRIEVEDVAPPEI